MPRSQFKGGLRLLIYKMQVCPHPCPRGALCHERAWSRHSPVTGSLGSLDGLETELLDPTDL